MTRDDLERLRALDIDLAAIGLEQSREAQPYFCTPVDAEPVGSIGCDGVHFVLLPGDERVFCVDPAMGEPGSYVLPVGKDLREFLAFLLWCRDACPLSQIWWMTEERFQSLLEEDRAARWPGCEEFFARKQAALDAVEQVFSLVPAEPYRRVKQLQAEFDPAVLRFSDEYFDVLGVERPAN